MAANLPLFPDLEPTPRMYVVRHYRRAANVLDYMDYLHRQRLREEVLEREAKEASQEESTQERRKQIHERNTAKYTALLNTLSTLTDPERQLAKILSQMLIGDALVCGLYRLLYYEAENGGQWFLLYLKGWLVAKGRTQGTCDAYRRWVYAVLSRQLIARKWDVERVKLVQGAAYCEDESQIKRGGVSALLKAA